MPRTSRRWTLRVLFFLGGVLSSSDLKAAEDPKTWTFTVSPQRDYREIPVSIALADPDGSLTRAGTSPEAGSGLLLRQQETGLVVPVQIEPLGDQVRVWWIARDLKTGVAQTFQLTFEERGNESQTDPPAVELKEAAEGVEVLLDGQLFTRYLTESDPKPICYPIIGPTGRPITRHFPMQQVAGEPQDHPHHRSLWFTQDEVNGTNFWAEGPGMGRQVHRKFETLASGPVFGLIRARTDWVKPDGTKVMEDTRELRVYHVANGRLFDFEVILRATEGPVEFGDTKEGTFGIRLTPSLQLAGGGGHIENARGQKDGEAWGKQAEWCDYYGPVAGETVGVAILNHPTSFRFPTYWHVRDYGLFAANPFGIRDFTGDPSGRGRYFLPQGETISFRYRIFLHHGDTAAARIADVYAAYAEPPEVMVQ